MKTNPGGAKKMAYGTTIVAVGREIAPNKSRFMSFLLPISGTRSAGMLVAWHVILATRLSLAGTREVLVGFPIRAWDGANTPFLLEHS